MGELPTKKPLAACKNACKLLAEAAYYEARGEGDKGMLAVMSVVNARAEHSSRRWPNTIEGVVKQRCEFSYRCDGSMKRRKDPIQWERAEKLAWWYMNTKHDVGFVAHYYHKKGIDRIPKFSQTEKYVGRVGNHVFYSCVNKYC
jgi:spore germination cell wall hydrolase CwlJ-like protein